MLFYHSHMEQITKPITPETFTFQMTSSDFMKRMYPTLGLMSFLGFIIFTAIINAIGLPAPWAFGLIVTGIFAYAMVKLKQKQFDGQWAEAHIIASFEGITSYEKYRTVHMGWNDIEEIGEGDFMRGVRIVPGYSARAANYFVDATATRKTDALIGVGIMTVADHTPSLIKTTIEQNLANGPKNADGKPKASIVIGMYEENWRSGQLGKWLQAYRPDLVGAGSLQGV